MGLFGRKDEGGIPGLSGDGTPSGIPGLDELPEMPSARSERRSRRKGGGAGVPRASRPLGTPPRSDRGLLVAFTLGLVLLFGGWLVSEERGADDEPASSATTPAPTPEDPESPADPTQPKPDPVGDLTSPSGLRRAIAAIRKQDDPEAELVLLRVARDRINGQTLVPGGTMRIVAVDAQGAVSFSDTPATGVPTFPWSRVDPAGLDRLIRTVARRADQPAANFDYGVVSTGLKGWNAFWKAGPERDRHWFSDIHGGDVHRPGEPSRADRIRDRCLKRAKDSDAVRKCLSP